MKKLLISTLSITSAFMKTNFIITFIFFSIAILACNQNQKNNATIKNYVPIKENAVLLLANKASHNMRDSLLLEKYEYEIKKEFIDDAASLTKAQLDSIFDEDRSISIYDSKVVYSPDSTFKIFTFTVESCGAYCNPFYYSWMHFDLKQQEKIEKVEFSEIDSIYKLEKDKFLIIDCSWGRPFSVMTIYCMSANLISFTNNTIKIHSVKRKPDENLSFCQEHFVEMEENPYIKYNSLKKTLDYGFGNNNYRSTGIDIDTIRHGQMKYTNGNFVLEKETITVNDQRAK